MNFTQLQPECLHWWAVSYKEAKSLKLTILNVSMSGHWVSGSIVEISLRYLTAKEIPIPYRIAKRLLPVPIWKVAQVVRFRHVFFHLTAPKRPYEK